MNVVCLIGRLTKDPVSSTVHLQDRAATVCEMRIAFSKNRTGVASFVDVVCWNGVAKACAEHLNKGDEVEITGSLDIQEWTTSSGTKSRATKVKADKVNFLRRKSS